MCAFLEILRCILCCEENSLEDSDFDYDDGGCYEVPLLESLIGSLRRLIGRTIEVFQTPRDFHPPPIIPSYYNGQLASSRKTHQFSTTSSASSSSKPPTTISSKSSVVHPQQSPSQATSFTLPLPPSPAKSFLSSESSEFSSRLPPSTINQGSETPYKPSSTPTKLPSNSKKPASLSTKSTASSSILSPSQPRTVLPSLAFPQTVNSVPNVNTSEVTEKLVKTNHVWVEKSPTNATPPYKPSSSSDNAPSLSSRSTASLSEPVLSSLKSPQNFHSVTNAPGYKETKKEGKKIQVQVEKSPGDAKTHETSTQTSKSLLRPSTFDATSTGSKTNYLQVQESLIYAIPEEIKSLFKKNIVPEILKQPLSPLTYKDYFAVLLYAEDFYLEKWSDFQLKNVILELQKAEIRKNWKGDDKTFAVFEIDSIPERRPFLLSRDLVYARRLGSKAEPFQGIIHRVMKSTRVLVEFGNDFHLTHHSTFRYNISFSFNRVCLKRAHQAVQAVSKPLFHNFLFPDFVSRGSTLKPPTMRSVYHKNQMDHLSVIRRILEIQRPPPYLVEGPLCVKNDKRSRHHTKELSSTGILVRDVICKLYQASQACRILVCAPINMTCDMLTQSLQCDIPDSDLFRANAAFRELDGVPIDILPSCLLEGERFACPSWQELKEFRVILSTYISSCRLHSAGISARHFSHIFLLDASSATEPETLVALTHFADDNTAVIVTGAPRNYSGWVRSDIARNHGLKESYFERLRDKKPYANLDPMFIAHLDDCEE